MYRKVNWKIFSTLEKVRKFSSEGKSTWDQKINLIETHSGKWAEKNKLN